MEKGKEPQTSVIHSLLPIPLTYEFIWGIRLLVGGFSDFFPFCFRFKMAIKTTKDIADLIKYIGRVIEFLDLIS